MFCFFTGGVTGNRFLGFFSRWLPVITIPAVLSGAVGCLVLSHVRGWVLLPRPYGNFWRLHPLIPKSVHIILSKLLQRTSTGGALCSGFPVSRRRSRHKQTRGYPSAPPPSVASARHPSSLSLASGAYRGKHQRG
jgi:hypothetical protein